MKLLLSILAIEGLWVLQGAARVTNAPRGNDGLTNGNHYGNNEKRHNEHNKNQNKDGNTPNNRCGNVGAGNNKGYMCRGMFCQGEVTTYFGG